MAVWLFVAEGRDLRAALAGPETYWAIRSMVETREVVDQLEADNKAGVSSL
jgi:hypothetical protein